jgi:ParB-like chromosome segregation protein Spo0J
MKRIRSELIALDKLQTWQVAESLLPAYSEPQYKDLEEFIANGGQLAPIVIAEDCRIIDGYNRWRTAKRMNLDTIECDIYSYADQSEMEIHAIVLNSKRRHLNRLQVARAAVRLADLISPDEPGSGNQAHFAEAPAAKKIHAPLQGGQNAEEEEQEGNTSAAPVSRPDQAMRSVSQKLGVSPSTVQRVSMVDKSGDERLIAAMEDKTISIRQAAEIAEMDEDDRQQAMEALDEEKQKRNNDAVIFSRISYDCMKRLQSSGKKIKDTEFSEAERSEMKASLTQVINEANALIQMLDGQPGGEG